MRVDTISALLDRYGQCVTLYRGGVEAGREVRAFLQPLREAGREQARPSPLGLRREDRKQYIIKPYNPCGSKRFLYAISLFPPPFPPPIDLVPSNKAIPLWSVELSLWV